MLDLTGKVALVMGCGRWPTVGAMGGHWRCCSRGRVRVRVPIWRRCTQETARLVRMKRRTCEVTACDATRSDQVAGRRGAVSAPGRIDILVNNVGAAAARRPGGYGRGRGTRIQVNLKSGRTSLQARHCAHAQPGGGAIVNGARWPAALHRQCRRQAYAAPGMGCCTSRTPRR